MRYVFFILFLFPLSALSQNTYKALVKDSHTHEGIAGASAYVNGTRIGAMADSTGTLVITGIPDGKQLIVFSFIGYTQRKDSILFPLPSHDRITVFLTPEASEMEEVVVEATRSNRSIENIPTRVEVLTEEIDEASTMDPSKIAHLLTHSTGIQVQQTSATSNTANVRIQGLDGRYTQILKDGFPIYGGFSGSLSIMQIPPLDLRQVEYVKGSASTLYGGGAIAGLINLLSKEPDKEENLLHLNASQVGAFDVNAFSAKRIGKLGYTLLAQRNSHKYFDADKDGYTDLPQLTKYNFNPRLFFYLGEKTKMFAGATFTSESRAGGDVHLLHDEMPDSSNFYKEENNINRITTQVKIERKLRSNNSLVLKNSFNFFDRSLGIRSAPNQSEYFFRGDQVSSFSEVSFAHRKGMGAFIAGASFTSDQFKEAADENAILERNELIETYGSFAQYTFDLGSKVSVESGLRADYVVNDEVYVLPRLSTLIKWSPKFTSRIGGGMGYRSPTLFSQEAELIAYQNVISIDKNNLSAERSYGGNVDIGFKTALGSKAWINFNQMFFITVLDQPLILTPQDGVFEFVHAEGANQSYGTETFFKLGISKFVFFAGYTYTHAQYVHYDIVKDATLTPRHSLKGDLLYSLPHKWRIGMDYEFKSSQVLSDGWETPGFWTFGLLVECTIRNFTLFGNIENLSNTRQTDYESLLSAPYQTPQFTEVWAPLDGFVFNAGIKIRM